MSVCFSAVVENSAITVWDCVRVCAKTHTNWAYNIIFHSQKHIQTAREGESQKRRMRQKSGWQNSNSINRTGCYIFFSPLSIFGEIINIRICSESKRDFVTELECCQFCQFIFSKLINEVLDKYDHHARSIKFMRNKIRKVFFQPYFFLKSSILKTNTID